MERRFGERARIDYLDLSKPEVRSENLHVMDSIRDEGLAYPVTLIGDGLVCEGAVSYPAILRAVDAVLDGQAG
jgi:disulfide oxidoreductase YuzD